MPAIHTERNEGHLIWYLKHLWNIHVKTHKWSDSRKWSFSGSSPVSENL